MKIEFDYAFMYKNEIKTKIDKDSIIDVSYSYETDSLWVSGVLKGSGEKVSVLVDFLDEWESLFNIDLNVVASRVERWQKNPIFHELTCGEDSSHTLLVAKIDKEKMTLVCPDCDYIQDWLPTMFYSSSFDSLYDNQREHMQDKDSDYE